MNRLGGGGEGWQDKRLYGVEWPESGQTFLIPRYKGVRGGVQNGLHLAVEKFSLGY